MNFGSGDEDEGPLCDFCAQYSVPYNDVVKLYTMTLITQLLL